MNAAIDLTGVRLETARLLLRPWEEKDLQDFFRYASVPGVGEMAGWPHHESVEISRKILNSFMAGKRTFALEEKATGRVIGSLGLEEAAWANGKAAYAGLALREIGYVLAKDRWGQGLMPEAVQRVIKWCFEERKLEGLSVGHFVENSQSRRVIEKCGFEYVENAAYTSSQTGETKETRKYILLNK